jgi:GT2 family glycosyltransferase
MSRPTAVTSERSSSPTVLAVVLNYKNAEHSARCASSVLDSEGVDVDVCIVDNDSQDGSADQLAARFGSERILRLPENTGYSGGMNAGLRRWFDRSNAPFVLLLTDDVTLERDAVAKLVAHMHADSRVGTVGPVVRHTDPPHAVFAAGGIIELGRARAKMHRAVQSPMPYSVEWIDGCCMLLRRGAIEQVGMLDERFFMYFEEVDLCVRMRQAGWGIMVDPTAVAYQTKDPTPSRSYAYYMTRNRFIFFRKHYGIGGLRVATHVAYDTLGLVRWWLSSVVTPSLRAERGNRARWVGAHLRWGTAGALAHFRGGAHPPRGS